MSLEIIRDEKTWCEALENFRNHDPCHRYSFHNMNPYKGKIFIDDKNPTRT